MVELNEKAVALAPSLERFGLDAVDLDMLARGDMLGSTGAKVFNALVALSAIPAPDDGLVEKLRYRVENPSAWDTFDQGGSDLIAEAAIALQSKDEQIERLTKERDEALEAEDEAKDSFWAIYPDWVQLKGHGISTEAARTMLAQRAEAAEQQVQKLTAEKERTKEALRPFGDAWIAVIRCNVAANLTMGQLGALAAQCVSGAHFRAARTAIETQEGGE